MSLDFVPAELAAAGELRVHFFAPIKDPNPPSWYHVPYVPAMEQHVILVQGFARPPPRPA